MKRQEDTDWVIAVAIGDDKERLVEVVDLIKLKDDDYCTICGQVFCKEDTQ